MRGRPPKNPKLPKYVRLSKSRYVYRPYNAELKKPGKEVVLCPGNATLATVWARYEQLVTPQIHSLSSLVSQYLESASFYALAPSTRDGYEKYANTIITTPLSGGGIFGDIEIFVITPGTVRKYLDKRHSAPFLANREVQFLNAVFSWAFERDMVKSNPCKGVRKYSEPPRQRYVTDDEYKAVYDLAHPHIQACMELAYLCRLRKIEILSMTRGQKLEEGLEAVRVKGSRTNIVRWSPRLRAAVNWCEPPMASNYVIYNRHGKQYTSSAFDNAWKRLMKKTVEEKGIKPFRFHDLKAKAISDDEGDKQKGSGHRTSAMVARYDRKTQKVDPVR